ncbi:MAG TPA: hypothetical protein VM450_19810 [Thermomicrobiales bacterium]|nr:hypothetical protein [Thermomicrobiales bacterium]
MKIDPKLTEVEPAKVTAAMKASGAAATRELVMLPVDEINVHPLVQPRLQSKQWQERVSEYAEDMRTHGYMQTEPIAVFTVMEAPEEGAKAIPVIYISNGHTRYAAVQEANKAGAKIATIPVIFEPEGSSVRQIIGRHIKHNNGQPLTPLEQAEQVRKLHEMGATDEEIAGEVGKTVRYVQDLMVLSSAPAPIRNAVAKGEIAASVAVREVRKLGGEKAAKRVGEAVAKAKAAGKKKATPSLIEGREKQTGKRQGEAADTIAPRTPAPPKGAIPDDVAFWRSAAEYAVDHGKALEGMRWLKAFLGGDEQATADLERWMGQPTGAFANPSLRTPEEPEEDEAEGL